MRLPALLMLASLVACAPADTGGSMSTADSQAAAAEIEKTLRDAYDLSKPGLTERMLSLYPENSRVISANSGRAITSRDTLDAGIRYFWDNVGVNMRNPRWEWERFWIDVLGPGAAVATATYRVPHLNPSNQPHVIGGAMTMTFARRGGRWVIVQEHLSDLPQTTDSSQTSMQPHDHH
ncbi:MAG TPA: nuclear transport factor 2 family protein [Gemmatimonadaceae bacterium]|nr:nuclear transport factor 2 family protein [Gemmatimonadaceae bacterium]